MNNKLTSGFTLIELMIAMAVAAILVGIAVPSYQESVMKAKRSEAKAALLGLAGAMERFYTVNNNYCGSDIVPPAVVPTPPVCTVGAPGIFSQTVPLNGGSTTYNLTISAVARNTFTLTATAIGRMASDKCGNFSLTNTNLQTYTGTGGTQKECW
jgi:type IV pilus assembly protein PilE